MRYHAAPLAALVPPVRMQIFIDYIPIVVFFVAYFVKDLYFATAVLMGVMPVLLAVQWLLTRKVNRIYLGSTVLVLVLGGATLFLRNPQFIYWKPTALNWIIALVFLGSQWVGDKPIVQRMLESAAELEPRQWQSLNSVWVGFFLLVGALNIWIAYNFSEAFWVNFKLFGMLGLTVVFILLQSLWLSSAMKKPDAPQKESEN